MAIYRLSSKIYRRLISFRMESGATPVLRQLKVYLHWRGFHPDQGRHLPKTKIDSYTHRKGATIKNKNQLEEDSRYLMRSPNLTYVATLITSLLFVSIGYGSLGSQTYPTSVDNYYIMFNCFCVYTAKCVYT
jgi:hypothetical protein